MELAYLYNDIVWEILWNSSKAIDIESWSICGDGRLERAYCSVETLFVYMYITQMHTCVIKYTQAYLYFYIHGYL